MPAGSERRQSTSVATLSPVPRAYSPWSWWTAGVVVLLGAVLDQTGMRLEGGAAAVLALVPILIVIDHNLMPGFLVGPATFICVLHAFEYALGPLAQRYILGRLDVIEEGLVPAQWGAAGGLLTFAVVYPWVYCWVCRTLPERSCRPADKESDWHGYGLLLLAVTIIMLTYGYVSGVRRLGGLSDVPLVQSTAVSAFHHTQLVMFFFLAYSAARRRGVWAFLWLAAFAGMALFWVLDGGRAYVLLAAIASAMGLALAGVRRWKIFLAAAFLLLLFVPLAHIVYSYRTRYPLRRGDLSERLSSFAAATFDFLQGRAVGERTSGEEFLQRITADSVDRVFLLTPKSLPYAGLEGIEKIVYAYVPQVIFPERPSLLDGNDLAIRYGAAPPGTTGSSMPAVGDGYRRFGWLGIGLLYALSATIFALVAALAWLRSHRREWAAMLVLVTIAGTETWMTTLLSNFYVLLWVMPKYLLFFLFLRGLADRLREIADRYRPAPEVRSPFSGRASSC